jgi:hypothetical protein
VGTLRIVAEEDEAEQRRRRSEEDVLAAWWAGVEAMPDAELVKGAGSGRGQEPAWRPQAQAALMVRLKRSIDQLRAETEKSSRRLLQLTWVLVILTVAITGMTVVLLVRA